MKRHHYLYLYQPIAKFFSANSVLRQKILLLAETTLLLLLIGYQLSHFITIV